LSERLEAGPLSHIEGCCLERRLILLPWEKKTFLLSWPPNWEAHRMVEQSKQIVASWDS
jgi:hypothetical protein